MSNSENGFFSRFKKWLSAIVNYCKCRLGNLFGKGKKPDKEKRAKRIVSAIFFVILACICVFVGIKLTDYTFQPETKPGEDANTGFIDTDDHPNADEHQAAAVLTELRDVNGLSSLLKLWSNNTQARVMREDGIYNFLLVGVDGGAANGYGNSDAIILVSVNTKKSVINMVSFYRDSYTYIASEYGDKYAKINAAYANGGAELLIKTVESDYKIDIDYYASVNFQTFVEVVDLLGGVTLNVPAYVANHINTGGSSISSPLPSGSNVRLDGRQALAFVRARQCDADADVSRTKRQREFISALVSSTKDIKLTQTDNLMQILCKYVKTDCSNTKILSLATQALREKWYSFPINSFSMPTEKYRTDYRGFGWVWIVDYPGAAHELQNILYGYSSFEIENGTVTAIELMNNVTTAPAATKAPAPAEEESTVKAESVTGAQKAPVTVEAPPAREETTTQIVRQPQTAGQEETEVPVPVRDDAEEEAPSEAA